MDATTKIMFHATDKLKALAVVNAFETGAAFGRFSTVAVLDDGAGVSYGSCQFTHRSGGLAAVLERYFELGGVLGRSVISRRLPAARRLTAPAIKELAADTAFRKALRAAGITDEMKRAQIGVALDRYLAPAARECARLGFVTPLALAVVYDSMVHGSWEKIRDRVILKLGEDRLRRERAWIAEYTAMRDKWLSSIPRLNSTRYRTKFFLNQIKLQNWELNLPVRANGVAITSEVIDEIGRYIDSSKDSAVEPSPTQTLHNANAASSEPPLTPQKPPDKAQPPSRLREVSRLDRVEAAVDAAAARYDQVERIATTVTRRNDAAKSLWTTVVGSISQTLWAVFGLLAGVPREVWLVVAVIAGALMLLYLYRQISLGKLRERKSYAFTRDEFDPETSLGQDASRVNA